jgi:hypothetical protein
LVPCPDCGMARVLEGRTQKEGENHGCLYFKCAKNSVSSLLCLLNLCSGSYMLWILQYAKNCGFYHFKKNAGVIVFRPSNKADMVDEVVDSVECHIGSGEHVCCKEVILMLKVVFLLHLCG